MGLARIATTLAERAPLPDSVIRAGMRYVIAQIEESGKDIRNGAPFAEAMAAFPIAQHTDTANAQHYELPPAFFEAFLGPNRKYSCCLYPTGRESLAEAEAAALAETVSHAGLSNGQDILELGCGWGSLTLWMAKVLPAARITAVSNSTPQRLYIEAQARARGLSNVTVLTADMNDFSIDRQFDRVVSVEMFEHMANWRALLGRVRGWIAPEGRLFLHVFSHETRAARYDANDTADWMAQHFFTGGIMPSHDLIRHFPDLFSVEEEWVWSGTNYKHTALQWLENFDRNRATIMPLLREVYGADAALWRRRWRMFFFATAESFGFADGSKWDVSHYRLKPAG